MTVGKDEEMKWKWRLPLISVVLFALLRSVGCRSNSPVSAQRQEVSTQNSQFGGFNVAVALSDKAKKRLVDGRETIIVAAYFSANPKPGTPKQYISDTGEIDLGEEQAEIAPGAGASFREIKLKKDALAQADDQGPQLLVNVYSGRKSSADNLLDCSIYQGTLKAVQHTSVSISCKLIGEK
jgi:hypothetical protein